MAECLEKIKDCLITQVHGQMSNLHAVDTQELGEAIDMIKDLAEAMYYCTITEAMKESSHEQHDQMYYRDMDREYDRMYYTPTHNTKEGKSYMSRRNYMESKMMSSDKSTHIKELEKYISELSQDITEMIEGASQDEKQLLQRKIATLAAKIV